MKRGGSFKVIAKVKNKGVGTADEEFAMGYYLSKNREKLIDKEDDIFLTDDLIVSSLLAGSRSKVKIYVNIPMDTPKGKYYVKVCADNRNDITEINEDNNCKASKKKIRINCTPVAETCNNIDDDCDGIIDNNLIRATACGTGACSSTGFETCSAGIWGNDTCTAKRPAAETCNNIDDDCDGIVDDNLMRPTTCGTGACSSTGTETCSAGIWGNDTCTVKQPAAETCNNIDDDCDGIVDDNIMRPTTCGTGACSSTGTETCSAGIWGNDTCTVKQPSVETCNNIDDDCDGQIDEDYIPVVTNCGQGICAATGQLICQNGLEVDTCIIGQPAENNETTCNDGIDNDCNGFTDNNDMNCPPTSDLALASVSEPPARMKRGKSFKVVAKVRNKGVGAADKEFAMGYYLSKNREKLINKEDDIFLTDDLIVTSLLAGSRSKVKIYVNIPMDTPKGKYYVKVCADNRNDIREINEDNNCKASKDKIRVK